MTTLLVDVYCCAIAAVVVAIIVVCTTRCSVSRVSLSVGSSAYYFITNMSV